MRLLSSLVPYAELDYFCKCISAVSMTFGFLYVNAAIYSPAFFVKFCTVVLNVRRIDFEVAE